ncbi:hypothetical protein BDW67DRAFT_189206 [Aspergillus spinulosporus]
MGLANDIEAIRHRQSARGAAGDSTQILVRAGAPSPDPTQALFTSFPSCLGIGSSTPNTTSRPVSARTQHSYGAHPSPHARVGLNPPLRFLTDPLPSPESEAKGLADSGNGLVYNARGIVSAHLLFPLMCRSSPTRQEGDVAFGWWADRGKLRKGEGTAVKTYENIKAVWVEHNMGVTLA